jgi:DNA-binding winged helix-turn-helix (wHTH) protein/predicted ATPase
MKVLAREFSPRSPVSSEGGAKRFRKLSEWECRTIPTIYAFGPFRLEAQGETLFRGTEPVALSKRAVALLRLLVHRAGTPVSKDALIEAAWPGLAVEEGNLTVQIAALRRSLREEPGGERWIETLPRRGYRFVGPIANAENTAVIERQTPATQHSAKQQAESLESQLSHAEPERRQLSIMSCELIWAGRDLEDRREAVRVYQSCVAKIVGAFQGSVGKYIGNTLLVYFGYPVAHENDAELAVRAGLELCAAVATLKVNTEIPLHCRVGIATGLVIIGDLVGETEDRDVIGETPGVAAQLHMSAQPSTVVIDEATRRLIGKLFDCRDGGIIEARTGNPVFAWRVLGVSTIDSRFEALRAAPNIEARRLDVTSPLLGRDEELELLLRRWAQAKAGEGRVIHITGEAGIGKSRLAQALVDCLVDDRHTRVQCHCSPYHTDSALHPIISHLLRAAGIEHKDGGEERLAKLETLLERSNSSLSETVPLLAPLLSIPLGERYTPLNLSPKRRKERTLPALFEQITTIAIDQPVLMVVEDAHWIDPTSLELLSLTVERVERLPVLLIITARLDFSPSWPTHRHISVMALGRLGQREGAAMAQRIARGKTLPTEVLKEIIDHADGVPLFIEELTKTVLEGGLFQEADDRYVLTGPMRPLAIPSTLHASLLARLDRLASVKDIAQIGAAIGREFSFRLIAALSAMPKQELEVALAQLVAAELIFQRGVPPDATYLFKHALVQDAAYASLLRGRRRTLHAAIVKELVAGSVSDNEIKPELLAHHCAEAGMAEDAVRHYLAASQRSVARSALAEAAVMLDKALGQVAHLPAGSAQERSELEVQCARGAVLIALKGLAAAETGKAYSRARDLWERLDRPREFLSVARGKCAFHLTRAEFLEAQSVAEDLLELSRAHGDTIGLILGYYARGVTHMYRGELLSARAKLEEGIGLYDLAVHAQLFQHAGTDPNATDLAALGHVLLLLGYPDQALMRAEAAIRLARQLAHAPTVAHCLVYNARQASILGDEARLAHRVQELRALTQEHGYPSWSALVPIYEGQLQLRQGQARAAVTLMRQGLDAQRATGETLWSAYFASLLGEALEQDGKSGEALSLLEDHIAAVSHTGELCFAAELHRRRGQLLLRGPVPDFAGAQAEFLQAMDIARRQSAKLWELRAAVSLARLWRDQDRNSDAHHLLSPIYAWFTEGFDCADLKAAKLLLDKLSVSQSPV